MISCKRGRLTGSGPRWWLRKVLNSPSAWMGSIAMDGAIPSENNPETSWATLTHRVNEKISPSKWVEKAEIPSHHKPPPPAQWEEGLPWGKRRDTSSLSTGRRKHINNERELERREANGFCLVVLISSVNAEVRMPGKRWEEVEGWDLRQRVQVWGAPKSWITRWWGSGGTCYNGLEWICGKLGFWRMVTFPGNLCLLIVG